MAVTEEQVLEYLDGLTVIQISQLVQKLEGRWGVSAAAPVAVAAALPVGGEESGPKDEVQTEFDVVLVDGGDKKINVIKVVRQITGLGLKEAKALVDGAPAKVKEGISKDDAETAKKQLEEAGAVIELK